MHFVTVSHVLVIKPKDIESYWVRESRPRITFPFYVLQQFPLGAITFPISLGYSLALTE